MFIQCAHGVTLLRQWSMSVMSGNRIIDVNGNVYANAFSALGNVSANGNIYANTGSIIALSLSGDGANITSISGNNIIGPVANATSAVTVTANAQPNITSVGNLSALSVIGNVGIGTTTPAVPLQVEGAIRFASNGVGANYLEFIRTAQNQWKLASNGVGDVFTIVGNAVTFPQNVIVKRGGLEVSPSLDNNTSAINIIQTWNNASVAFSLIKANVTDTASNASSLLMDLQVGGASKFTVGKGSGSIKIDGNMLTLYNPTTLNFNSVIKHMGNESLHFVEYGQNTLFLSGVDFTPSVQIPSNKSFGWSSSTGQTQGDLVFYRDGTDTFAQRRGANAQTTRIYGTFTDVSNYERLSISANVAGHYIIGEEGGTGLARSLFLGSNNTTYMTITGTGNVGIGTTSPATRLHIEPDFSTVRVGNPSATDVRINLLTANTAGGWNIRTRSADGSLSLEEEGIAQRLTISKTTGNVGIGTTTPSEKLYISNAGSTFVRINSNDNAGNVGLKFSGAGDRGSIYATGGYDIYIEPNAQYGQADVIFNPKNGSTMNVGIGNTAPAHTLSVTGTMNVSGNANVGNLGTAQVLATANIIAPQLISNVVTGTAPLVVTSTTQVANLNVATAGIVTSNAQPNITSVGTLASLDVTGNITCANVTASSYHVRSVNSAVTATGTTQADAAQLTKEINVVSTVAVGTGVILPVSVPGMVIIINNTSANTLNVYPAVDAIINSGAANAAYTHAAGSSLQYYSTSATQWYTTT